MTDDELRDRCETLERILLPVLENDPECTRRVVSRLARVVAVNRDVPMPSLAAGLTEHHQERRRRLAQERRALWRTFEQFRLTVAKSDHSLQAPVAPDVMRLASVLEGILKIPSGRPTDENRRAIVYGVVEALDLAGVKTPKTKGSKAERVAREVLRFVGDTQIPVDLSPLMFAAIDQCRATGATIQLDSDPT